MNNNIQIFHFNLQDHQDTDLKAISCLSEDELRRANRYLRAKDKENFILQRYLIKKTLRDQLGLNEIIFKKTTEGKLYIPDSKKKFNISHSKEHLVLAINNSGPIGVDLECLNLKRDILALSNKLFNLKEKNHFLSLRLDEQIKFFYKTWTQKEAYLKYIGTGINQSLTTIDLTLSQDLYIKTTENTEYICSWITKI